MIIEVASVNPTNLTVLSVTPSYSVTVSTSGVQGPSGVGVPTGGTTGQVLAKSSSSDYATQWVDQAAGGGGAVSSVNGRTGAVTLSKTDVGLGNVPNVDATARASHTGTQAASTITGLATVATSGAYSDLSGRPTIPTQTSQLTNNSGFVSDIDSIINSLIFG